MEGHKFQYQRGRVLKKGLNELFRQYEKYKLWTTNCRLGFFKLRLMYLKIFILYYSGMTKFSNLKKYSFKVLFPWTLKDSTTTVTFLIPPAKDIFQRHNHNNHQDLNENKIITENKHEDLMMMI